jgi:pyruvate formate lyase activating enzyme
MDQYSCQNGHAAGPEGSAAAVASEPGAITGYLHSFDATGALDGPGVRFVVFTSGCLLRCRYCHNPETWSTKNGAPFTVDEVMAEIGKYERFLKVAGGGVTISGGEPLVQDAFTGEVLRRAKALGLHTALDTSGFLGDRATDGMLESVDLVLLDIKSWDPDTYRRVTGRDVEPTLAFARRLSDMGKPVWVRFVLVPGLTDDFDNVEGLADFVATLNNVERVEVLPFHQMGKPKWEALNIRYQLADTEPPSAELLDRVVGQFRARGLEVYAG